MGQNAHQGNVLNALMAAAVFPHGQAGMRQAELHIGIDICHTVANLFIGTPRPEQRKGGNKGHQPFMGHAGCRANHVRLGNSEIEETLWILRFEQLCHCGARKVCVQHDNLAVFFAQLTQLFAVGNSQRLSLSHYPAPPILQALFHILPGWAPCRASPPDLP